MRVDVVLRGMDVATMTDCARVADQVALRLARSGGRAAAPTLWLPESPGDRNPLVIAAALLASTVNVRVGTGVAPIPLRATIDLLAGAMTLAETYPGRFDLGVGSGNVASLARAGVAVEQTPLTVAREFLAAVADLDQSQGLSTLLDLPATAARPPVYLAAHNRRMIETAVRHADGVILNLVAGSDLPATVAFVRGVAERAGRSPRIGLFQLTALGGQGDAVAAARRVLAGFLRSPAVRSRLASFGSRHTELPEPPPAADDETLARAIPDDVVADFGPTTVDTLTERLRTTADLGVDFVALSVFPAPLRLRKPFPPVPPQVDARQATIDLLNRLEQISPVPAGSTS